MPRGRRKLINPMKMKICTSCDHKQPASKGDTCEVCHSPMRDARASWKLF